MLIVIAGLLDGGARTSLWIIAIAVDIGVPALRGVSGFHIKPGHFAERYGLIIIIALGESIVAVGSGAGLELTTVEVIAGVLAIAAIAALWWAYFDIVALVAEKRLHEAGASEQATLARDSYSYLHYPMIAGIVLLALGLEEGARRRGRAPEGRRGRRALRRGRALPARPHRLPPTATCSTLNVHRSVATFLLLALIPLALEADAVVSLALVSAVLVGPDRIRDDPLPRRESQGPGQPRRDAGRDARAPPLGVHPRATLGRYSCQGVRIRGPSAVTATVNSKWAASESSAE